MNHEQAATISPTILGARTVRIASARRPLLIYWSQSPDIGTLPASGMQADDSRLCDAASCVVAAEAGGAQVTYRRLHGVARASAVPTKRLGR